MRNLFAPSMRKSSICVCTKNHLEWVFFVQSGLKISLSFFIGGWLCFHPVLYAGEPVAAKTILAGDYSFTKEYLSWLIKEEQDDNDIPAISIALVNDQQLIWAEGFGYANKAQKIKAMATTTYRTGSISALFTALAILKYVEQGTLDLDRALSFYLPDFRIKRHDSQVRDITLRDMLSHHSGLPMSYFKGMWSMSPEPLTGLLEKLSNTYAAYSPGFIYSYSNVAYSLLGLLIERQSQQPFEQYMQKQVFGPLGMSLSSFVLSPQVNAHLAKGYRDGKLEDFFAVRDYPALGLYSNVIDLAKFLSMVLNHGVINGRSFIRKSLLDEMITRQNGARSLGLSSIGLGWRLDQRMTEHHEEIAWTYGATLLHRSRITLMPKHGLGVVVLANSTSSFKSLEKITNKALALLLQAKTAKSIKDSQPAPNQLPKFVGLHQDYASVYATRIGLINTDIRKKYIEANVLGWDFRLKPRADNWYDIQYRFLGFIPIGMHWVADVQVAPARILERDVIIARYQGQSYLFGEPLLRYEVPSVWQQRVGRYEIDNRDEITDLLDIKRGKLAMEGEWLVFSYEVSNWFSVRFKLPIQPLSDTQAIIPGLGTGLNETLHVVNDGKQEKLFYSGYYLVRK